MASKLSRDEAIGILVDIIRTPVGHIHEGHSLAQEFRSTPAGTFIKMPGKLEAMDKLAKLLGWYDPEANEVNVKVTIGGITRAG